MTGYIDSHWQFHTVGNRAYRVEISDGGVTQRGELDLDPLEVPDELIVPDDTEPLPDEEPIKTDPVDDE